MALLLFVVEQVAVCFDGDFLFGDSSVFVLHYVIVCSRDLWHFLAVDIGRQSPFSIHVSDEEVIDFVKGRLSVLDAQLCLGVASQLFDELWIHLMFGDIVRVIGVQVNLVIFLCV